MPSLALDPVPILETADSGLLRFRDNVQLNWDKLNTIVNKLDGSNIKDGSLTASNFAAGAIAPKIWWSRFSMGPTNTGSGVYVDVTGWVDLAFTKTAEHTGLFFTLHGGAYHGVAGNAIDFGLLVNGSDIDLTHFFFNQANVHHAFSASIGGFYALAAGAYTARLRWKTTAAGANIDGNDLFSLRIEEII